jgi:hypothetical protein
MPHCKIRNTIVVLAFPVLAQPALGQKLRKIQLYEITRTQRIDCGSDPGELGLNIR